MAKCELLEIGSTIRSIQAPFLDLHDIRLDVMEDTLREGWTLTWSKAHLQSRPSSNNSTLYKQSNIRL